MSTPGLGKDFEDRIRKFLKYIGFKNVPEPRTTLELGGQEVDAFGRDGSLYVVIDAKTKNQLGGGGVHSQLSVINGYRKEVIEGIKKRYQKRYDFREAVFIFWVANLRLKKEHQTWAKRLRIGLRDDFDLDYYKQASKVLDNSIIVRNSFLKDISNQLPRLGIFQEREPICVSAIATKFGTKTLLTFPIGVRDLLKIAYVFRIEMNNIVGSSYQRLLIKSKMSKIRAYIRGKKGFFPNNLIAVSETRLKLKQKPVVTRDDSLTYVTFQLPNKPCYLEILDGQHRLYGYSNLTRKKSDRLWVTIIQGLTREERAKLFVTINRQQTPVDPDILWDLYQITERRKKLGKISEFVYKLNTNSPFQDLIWLPRVRSRGAYLSFSNFCLSLETRSGLWSQYGKRASFLAIIRAYFQAFKDDPDLFVDWERSTQHQGKRGFILTNNSVSVLLRLLKEVLSKTGIPDEDQYESWKDSLKELVVLPTKAYMNKNITIANPTDPYRSLRKLTSELARKDAAKEIWKISTNPEGSVVAH